MTKKQLLSQEDEQTSDDIGMDDFCTNRERDIFIDLQDSEIVNITNEEVALSYLMISGDGEKKACWKKNC